MPSTSSNTVLAPGAEVGLDDGGARGHHVEAPGRDDLPRREDVDVLAETLDDVHDVLDDDDLDPVTLQHADALHHELRLRYREPGHDLVEQQHPGSGGHAAPELQAAHLAR